MSDELKVLIEQFRCTDPILSTMDDRKLILYIVNKALDEETQIFTDSLKLSRTKNVKLKKTRKISGHFNSVNEKYKNFGVNISPRQYFHRLILAYILNVLGGGKH
ncbi:hypothetical protein NAF29_11040 [Echinimonas agarilytica]|uniref:Uncharacterized protein n=2 Tax=Echinimonas agarilytica TaxID=1215918 RepID=A0AA42B8G8_9GAMM|nr:hypothetical protein [Echinimonas agarilytica]